MAATPQLPLDLRVERVQSFQNYRATQASAVVPLLRAHAGGYSNVDQQASAETVVFVWGTTGSGKTHLLQSCARHARECGRTALYTAGCEFGEHVLAREFDLLCVDNVDQLVGDAIGERNLLGAFEQLRSGARQLVVSARQPPSALHFSLADLGSRLMWGPVLRLDPLSDEELHQHFRAQAERYGLPISPEVIEYILRRCPRNAAYLEGLAAALHEQSLAEKRHVSVHMVSQLLN